MSAAAFRHLWIAPFGYAGVTIETLHALVGEFADCRGLGLAVTMRADMPADALISRARSVVFSDFLAAEETPEMPKPECLFMLDRDIRFRPLDLVKTAAMAVKHGAIVAGLYACRAEGHGFASRAADPSLTWVEGADELHPARYLGSGFLAISRLAAETIAAAELAEPLRMRRCHLRPGRAPGRDAFRPIVVDDPALLADVPVYLSEDWAFSARARGAGVPLYLWSGAVLGHIGHREFQVADGLGREIILPPKQGPSVDTDAQAGRKIPRVKPLRKRRPD